MLIYLKEYNIKKNDKNRNYGSSFTREIICNIRQPFDIFLTKNYYNVLNHEIENIEKLYQCKIFTLEKFNTQKYKFFFEEISEKDKKTNENKGFSLVFLLGCFYIVNFLL
jgi:hypothetical protein